MVRQLIIKVIEKNLEICNKLNRSQKFYYFGCVSTIFTIFLCLTPFDVALKQFTILTIILISCGIVSDILGIFNKVWKTYLGKGFILVLYATATNIAYALSAIFVNELVRFETSKLIYTINFVAVLLIPLFIFVSTIFFFSIFLLFSQFQIFLIAHRESLKKSQCFDEIFPKEIEYYPYTSLAVRVFIIPIIFGIIISVAKQNLNSYLAFMESKTKLFIYMLEAKNFSRCEKKADQKAIYVNDKEVILITKNNNNYIFEAQPCVPKLKALTTPKQESR